MKYIKWTALFFFLSIWLSVFYSDLSLLHTHVTIPPTCTDSAVCTICYQNVGSPLDHVIVDATCTDSSYCVRCQEKFGDPLEHTMMDATCTESAYCSHCQEKFCEPLGHAMVDAICTESAYCSRCQEKFGEPLGHTKVDATCTKSAYCSRCQEKFGEPLGHKMVAATCTEKQYCSRCHKQFGKALGHRKQAATCTTPSICTRCHSVLAPANGHRYTSTVLKEPTCVDNGQRKYMCSQCDAVYYEKIPALGHSLKYSGHTANCSRCRYSRVYIQVEALYQGAKYPNGCESVTTVMALRYAGIDIATDTFVSEYLPMAELPVLHSDEPTSEDPSNAYIGDPRLVTGLYCFAPVIETAVNDLIDPSKYSCTVHKNRSIEELCTTYLDQGVPVILWTTLGMTQKQYNGLSWQIQGTNEKHQMIRNLHCVLLVGYDDTLYYIQDPLYGSLSYTKDSVQTAYVSMGQQAITIMQRH